MLYHKKGKETYSFGVISWLLIRRLIQLHKGKILFCSNKNKKASVILTFPIVFRKFSSVQDSLSVTSLFRTSFSTYKKHPDEEAFLLRDTVCGKFSERENREKHSILLVEENRIQFILNTGVIRRIQCLYGI